VLWAELGGLVVTAIALLVLLRPLGIMGAALASVLGYAAVLVMLVGASRVLTQRPAMALLCPGRQEIDRIRQGGRRLLEKRLLKQAVEPVIE